MADTTPRIKLPYIVASQAQKEVTHNEALDMMDFFAGPVVKGIVSALPSSPADGDAYLISSTAANYANNVANRVNGTWQYYEPFEGLGLLNKADEINYVYKNSAWVRSSTDNPVIAVTGTDAVLTIKKLDGTTNDITVNNVAHATLADKATADADGNVIADTYATKAALAETDAVVALKAPLANPTFTGTVAVPTPASTSNDSTAASTSFVQTIVALALKGALVYKGTWSSTGQTDFSSITLPIKAGYGYFVTGEGCTINSVEYKAGDYIFINTDVAAGGTIDPTYVDKVDNTETADIVRLEAEQTLTNKTLAAPTITGDATAVTQAEGDSSTKLATTAFVQDQIAADIATQAEAEAGTSDTKIMSPLKVKEAVIYLINDQDNFAGSMFDGINSSGTKLGLAKNWTWEKSSDTYAGQDDYRKYGPFNQQRFLVKTDSNGVAQVVDWEGTSSFDNHLHDDDFGADPFVKFDLSYVRRYIDTDGKDYRMVSDRYLPGYHIPKIFLRGSGNTKYPWIGISCRAICKDTNNNVTMRSGRPIMYNKNENQYESLMRAKGLYVMGQNEVNYIQHLGTIKYNSYNWQQAVGRGIVDIYYNRDKSCTVAQTSANSIIVSNANAAYVSVGDYIGFNGSGSCQPDLPVTSIDTYDDSNKKITLDGLSLTSVVGDTGFYRMCNWGGETDAVLGLDGSISTKTDGKRSVLTLGIEDFYGNHWKILGGACRIGSNIWINPDPDTGYTWPTSADNAATIGWVKLGTDVCTTEGWIKTIAYNADWPLTNYCGSIGGNSSNPVGDYNYVGSNMSNAMMLLLGGNLSNGSNAGPFSCYSYYGVSSADWSFGALGVYKPL